MAIAVHRKPNPEDAARVQSVAWCGRRAEPVRLAAAAGDAHCLSAPGGGTRGWRMVALWRLPCTGGRILRMLPVYCSRLLRHLAALHASAAGGLALPLCKSLADAAVRREFPNCATNYLAAPFLFRFVDCFAVHKRLPGFLTLACSGSNSSSICVEDAPLQKSV